MLKKILVFLSLAILIWSCGGDKEQPITKDEAVSFAHKVETSLKKGNHEVFDSIFNEKVFAKRIVAEAGAKSDKNFMKGVMQGLGKIQMGKEIIGSMRDGGSYEFVRHYEKENKHHLIFRLFGSDGINYHDIELVKTKNRIGAADMFIYMTGEHFSKTIANLMGTLIGYADKKSEQAANHYASYMRDIKTLLAEQKYTEAKETYDKLPEEFKKSRFFQLMNIQISSQLGEETYKAALDAYERSYSNDPSSQLALIDAYFLRKDFDKMLNAIEMVDKAVQDPLLNYYRALAYTQMKDVPNTIKYLELLRKEKPGFGDGILELIANYVEVKEYYKASQLVQEYKANNTFNQEKLNNIRLLYPADAERVGL